jgi:hypothetical protein
MPLKPYYLHVPQPFILLFINCLYFNDFFPHPNPHSLRRCCPGGRPRASSPSPSCRWKVRACVLSPALHVCCMFLWLLQ